MSTIEVKMFSLVCDRCGADVNEGTDYSCWGDIGPSRDIAVDSGWLLDRKDGKDYCPECLVWNDNGSAQIPRPYQPTAFRYPSKEK
jgi:hypothetical protein